MNSEEGQRSLASETEPQGTQKEGGLTGQFPCPPPQGQHPRALTQCTPSPALTQLVGERQCEGGLPQGAFQQGPVAGAPLGMPPVQIRDRQVAELPGGVGRAPALIPADAAASVQAGNLAEIYDIDLKVTADRRTQQHPPYGQQVSTD